MAGKQAFVEVNDEGAEAAAGPGVYKPDAPASAWYSCRPDTSSAPLKSNFPTSDAPASASFSY